MTALAVESVLRSLLMAAVVWGGIKLLRVHHVLAQKVAWELVLLAAFAMPALVKWQAAHPGTAMVVPVKRSATVNALARRVSRSVSRGMSLVAADPGASHGLSASSSFSALLPTPLVSLQSLSSAPAKVWHVRDLLGYVLPVYLVVCGAMLLRLFFGLVLAIRIWRNAEMASPILEPRATVRISSMIQSPVTIGSGIVLPADYTEWDRAKLRLVLAHERSHVRQGDFYLQLLASFYAAVVWFSPLGWWLKRQLAELGEALSDRAALLEAEDNSAYAEVLLEFAAMPRQGFAGVTVGVGMARSSNIQGRIERILNERIFRGAFVSGRRHAVIAALLVPCGLVFATSLLHVQAAEIVKSHAVASLRSNFKRVQKAPAASSAPAVVPAASAPPTSPAVPAPAAATAAPRSEDRGGDDSDTAAEAAEVQDSAQDAGSMLVFDDERPFAIVDADHAHEHNFYVGSWNDHGDLDRIRSKVQGSFIWFERDGKSYVITDPALIAKCKALYAPQGDLGRQQAELGKRQAELGRQQALLASRETAVKVQVPDISKEMEELQHSMKALQQNAQGVTQGGLGELQAQLGEIQGKLAAAQAVAGSQQGMFGSQQGELGRKQGELGRLQGELGREQGRIARDASRQVQSAIDQAFRDGKAKLVE